MNTHKENGLNLTPLVQKLTKGNTFAQYDSIFNKANLKNYQANSSISAIIDLTLCNAGAIVNDEIKSILDELDTLNKLSLDKTYKQLLVKLFTYIQNSMSLPQKIQDRFVKFVS